MLRDENHERDRFRLSRGFGPASQSLAGPATRRGPGLKGAVDPRIKRDGSRQGFSISHHSTNGAIWVNEARISCKEYRKSAVPLEVGSAHEAERGMIEQGDKRMDVISDTMREAIDDGRSQVVVSPTASASIGQLHPDEREALYVAIGEISANGLTGAAGITATELESSERAYYLRIAAAPDVRVIARKLNVSMIEVLDVVRPQTLHNLFHAS